MVSAKRGRSGDSRTKAGCLGRRGGDTTGSGGEATDLCNRRHLSNLPAGAIVTSAVLKSCAKKGVSDPFFLNRIATNADKPVSTWSIKKSSVEGTMRYTVAARFVF